MIEKITTMRKKFREMHAEGNFILPNAHDVGSAKILADMEFGAIATTSAGFATSIGMEDFSVPMETSLNYFRNLVEESNLPINADFESGFAINPADVADNVLLAIKTGISGISIEDRWNNTLLDITLSANRIRAIREAIDSIDPNIILVGRSEGFLVGENSISNTIERLKAYSDAGADVLYAPGVTDESDIKAVVDALHPKSVNVLLIGTEQTVNRLFSLGVRRVSAGGFLTQATYVRFFKAANMLKLNGKLMEDSFQKTSA